MKSKKFPLAALLAMALVSFSVVDMRVTLAQRSARSPTQKTVYRPTGNEARITGTVTLDGHPPERREIDTAADSICAEMGQTLYSEDVVVNDGKLANVFVYVKGGPLASYDFAPPSTEVVLERAGCRYNPRALGVQTHQLLKVINSDPTTHNLNALSRNNPPFNISQGVGSAPFERKFDSPEMFIPFKCNQHPWEKAWVGVFAHPFFAVSDSNGNYHIEGLPPGDYTVVAWQEKYGEQTTKLTVYSNQSLIIDFAFNVKEVR